MKSRSLITAISILVLLALIVVVVRIATTPAEKDNLGEITDYTLSHKLDPESFTLSSEATFTWNSAGVDTFYFLLHNGLTIDYIQAESGVMGELLLLGEGEELPALLARWEGETESEGDYDHLALYALPLGGVEESTVITMAYNGIIHDVLEVPEFSRWEIADETSGIIDPKGAFLTPWTGYYPVQPGETPLTVFETTISMPKAWEGLVEGNILDKSEDGDTHSTTFTSAHKVDGCYLVAGPYKLKTLQAGRVEIAMYYYPKSERLVDRYLGMSAGYIADYEKLIGPYAFDRFSIVENWFPTGYGMPSYTLLGSEVLALPFIPFTSLPHEICHNWWGNGALVDYETGNWCEGLTVYSADYRLKRESSPEDAKQYRLDLLRDYSDYIVRGDEEDFPLTEFTGRTTAGTRTIGYGKAMMVYHMVEQKIGSEMFWDAMQKIYSEKQFTRVNWTDFFDTFSELSGQSFKSFQKQWIMRDGAPEFSIKNVQTHNQGESGSTRIEFDLSQVQEADPFIIDVPVQVELIDGTIITKVLRDVRGRMYHARIEVEGEAVGLAVDPDFHLFRVLDPLEAPSTLAGFYGAEKPVVVLPESGTLAEAYRTFAEAFFRRGNAEFITESDFDPAGYKGRSILRFGNTNVIQRALSLLDGDAGAGAVVATEQDANDPGIVHVSVWASSADQLTPILSKLPHYGKYSYLAFNSGKNVGKGQWEITESPLKISL